MSDIVVREHDKKLFAYVDQRIDSLEKKLMKILDKINAKLNI